jgi:hypothetical protein
MRFLRFFFAVAIVGVAPIAFAFPQYRMQEYRPLPNISSSLKIEMVDDGGVGYGSSWVEGESGLRGTIYRNGQIQRLPKFVPGDSEEIAKGRSSDRRVFGSYITNDQPFGYSESWHYDEQTGRFERFGGLIAGISRAGFVYGRNGQNRASIYNGNSWQSLPLPQEGDYSTVLGISDAGDVVGNTVTGAGFFSRITPWRVRNGVYQDLTDEMQGVKLGGITGNGMIFGVGFYRGVRRPFVHNGGIWQAFGETNVSYGPTAFSMVNDAGQAVAQLDHDIYLVVMTLDQGQRRMVDVIGWTPEMGSPMQLSWMSPNGTVAGATTRGTAFIATPVPEPATIAVLGLGTVVVLRRRRSSR